ncbi:MAG: hypothetical protein LC648_07515 [Novosphingobium sp.]|nr:hypothetical protein [Novosphingobium sp.]
MVVNRGGGTAGSLGDALEHTLREAFAGQAIDLRLVEGRDVAATVEEVAGTPVVAVGGGDGTQGSAAAVLAGSETALAILPLGTRNHLARDLQIPTDLGEAAKVAAGGCRESIDLARAGDRVFVNNASIGLYTRLVRERDKRAGPKWLGTLPAAWTVLRTMRAKPFALAIDGKRRRVVTPLLFIGNNRYSLDAGKLGQRETLTDSVLSLLAIERKSVPALLGFAVRALFGRADAQRDFCELTAAREVTIEGTGEIEVAFDGEVERMPVPLKFAIMPAALQVMVPAEATDA